MGSTLLSLQSCILKAEVIAFNNVRETGGKKKEKNSKKAVHPKLITDGFQVCKEKFEK